MLSVMNPMLYNMYYYRNYITNNGCAETKPSANCKFNNFSKLFPPFPRIFTHFTRKPSAKTSLP